MKNMHLAIIATFACAVFFLSPSYSYASTCAVKETIYSAPQFFLLSDNVFAGTVTSISDYGNHQWLVHFDIEKIWKGVATRQTSTVMTSTLQACGYSIIAGEKYLIYTNGSPSFINPIYSKLYSDAQDDITLFDDPKFQSEEKIKEELNKKLEAAQGRVGSMMMDKSSHIPIVTVGVDQVNSTLDITIDDQRATRSIEQYRQDLKEILGDIPIKVEFGHATTLLPILRSADDKGKISYPIIGGSNSGNVLKSPLQQFKSGIVPENTQCLPNLALVIKTKDGIPSCVKYTTADALIERGWAKRIVQNITGSEATVIIPTNSSIINNGFTFSPAVARVVIGENNTVKWINMDSVTNDITSDTGYFKQTLIESGYAWAHTFDKTGTYEYHSNIHPWLKGEVIVTSNPLINLKNDTGIITLGNQTYYFETPSYTNDAYSHPVQISFHDVVFTLFPNGFRGGLPSSCGVQYYWTDAKFLDDSGELLHIFAGPNCPTPPLPTYFSNHTNPQAGLTFYDGKMKLLVSIKNQTSLQLTSHQILSIFPGEHILSSCGGGAVQYHSSSNILNSTGFSVYHNVMNYSYITNDDYVIQPGHHGTITYVIDAGSSPTSHIPYPVQKELNITNYAIFYHRITDYEELSHNPSVTISGGDYKSCFKRPDGSCAGVSGPITGRIDATVVDHPGVNVSFEPAADLLQYNDTSKGKSSQIITMTISVDNGAPQGTYWVILSPEECRGGEIFLLTVGDKPYHS